MFASFLIVSKQVLSLFIVMAVGFVLGKVGIIQKQGSRCMSDLILYVVNPAVTIMAFQRPLDTSATRNLLIVILLGFVLHGVMIALSYAVIHDTDTEHRSIFRLGVVFANCGCMGYPLMQAMVGSIGVFYGSAYVLSFTVLIWTWGVWTISGGKEKLSLKKAVFNPGVLSVALAMAFYFLQITLPEIIATPLNYLSDMLTPLAMIVVGYQLSHCNFRKVFSLLNGWIAFAFRLLIIPSLVLVVYALLKLDQVLGIVIIIASAGPAASMISMFAETYCEDTDIASSMVSAQTVCSALTLPVMVALIEWLG